MDPLLIKNTATTNHNCMNILSADLTIGQNEVFILYVLLYSFTIQHVNSNTVSIKVVK